MPNSKPFWQVKRLEEMSRAEWEALCDGCGRCCLLKLEDEETGEIAFTDVACSYLDHQTCRCRDYANRHTNVPGCVALTPENVRTIAWLPSTCAYRLLAEGRDLYWWHPLVSGRAGSVHQAGMSVRGRVVAESAVPDELLEEHVVEWPTWRDPWAPED